jgi:Cu(I)/Ag(I) efflux system membrane fusion protein
MNRAIAATAVALIAAAGSAFVVASVKRPAAFATAIVTPAAADDAAPAYYQHPDGKPLYSPTPMKTPDGRDYVPVMPDAEPAAEAEPASKAKAKSAAHADRRIKYYRNPMGLPDTSSTPKKDSMGMDYIAVFEGDDTDDGSVKLSPGKIQRTGAKSEPVARRVIKSTVRAFGTIQEDERRVSVVALRFEGFVESVANVTTGQHVHKGQELMRVYSSALSSAAAEYLTALDAGTTGRALKGARRRLENLNAPDAAIAELERTREISLSVPWLAPQDGEILERNAVHGMRAAPGEVLFRIADHRMVWVVIDVAERDLSQISLEAKVIVRPRALQGQSFAGTVSLIYPHLNAQTRTARIRVEMPNPDELLRPDMYVDADIDTGASQPVLAVPESAVLDSGTRQAVLLDKGDGRFEPRDVKLGRRGGGYVEIRDGLKDNEPVVVSANFLIDAESNLRAALKGFSAAGDQP